MKLAIVVQSLGQGGAERQAAITARALAERGHSVQLVVFHDDPHFGYLLDGSPVEVRSLRSRTVGVPLALFRALRECRPEVVYSFLPGPNLLALALRSVVGRPPIVWGVRSTSRRLDDESRLGSVVCRLEPCMSRSVDLVIANSAAGRADALASGIRPLRFEVVPNGIEAVGVPMPDAGARRRARERLGVHPDGLVVGRLGRVHPMKDLPTLFRAVATLPEQDPPIDVVVAGRADSAHARALKARWGDHAGWARIVWAEPYGDAAEVLPAFDLTVSSSSYGEGFPNVVAESMAHGIPVVGSDVGDTAAVIGDPAMVVPPEDPAALARVLDAVLSASAGERRSLGAAQRRSIEAYSVERMVDATERLLSEVLAATAHAATTAAHTGAAHPQDAPVGGSR